MRWVPGFLPALATPTFRWLLRLLRLIPGKLSGVTSASWFNFAHPTTFAAAAICLATERDADVQHPDPGQGFDHPSTPQRLRFWCVWVGHSCPTLLTLGSRFLDVCRWSKKTRSKSKPSGKSVRPTRAILVRAN